MPKLLDKLERRFGRFAVPNVTQGLILGQMVCYLLVQSRPEMLEQIILVPRAVMAGEVWRLVTFLIIPPATNIIFAAFGWYIFFIMGSALEAQWGALRYDVFLAIGYIATVAAAFLIPGAWDAPTLNIFLGGTVFLAFAYLFPDFEMYIFFILPVKVKYLAMLTWAMYGYSFAVGGWAVRAAVAAGVANFFLFFGRDVLLRVRSGKRRMQQARQQITRRERPFHECTVCGITEKTHPQMDFRYCSKCTGSYEYCAEHLRAHEHVVAGVPDPAEPR